ncbi:MAG: pitrilysin family protein [Bryobacteraceae bacterium]
MAKECGKAVRGTGLGVLLCLGAAWLPAQNLSEFERKVTEFTLPNGLHFILVERHDAAVIAFHTYVKAGSADDAAGQTGLANLVARVTVKGTETLGTRGWEGEKKALDAAEQAYGRLQAERNKGLMADTGKAGVLDTQWRIALEGAQSWVDPNAYSQVIQDNGGTNLSLKALPDSTEFSYSLPSNKAELWFLLESQRLTHPVFREFYRERDRALEEHRLNLQGKALPRVEAALLATAFEAHPYRNPPDGWPSDVANLGVAEAQAFFAKYYVPANMVIAIAGDIYPSGARLLADQYFGEIPARPAPPRLHTEEPPQLGTKSAVVGASPQGLMAIGYKRPDERSRDDAVLDVIQTLLSGPSGILQRELVEKGIAWIATAQATFPAGRDPNLFLFLLAPAPGHTLDDVQNVLNGVLAQVQNRPVNAETLAAAKAQIRMGALRRLENNADLAALLPAYYAGYGDWRSLFRELDDSTKVTAEAVARAAIKYFTPVNRTVVYLATENRGEALPGRTGGQQ